MNSRQLQKCLIQAEHLTAACQDFPDNQAAQNLAHRLKEAIAFCKDSNQNKPLTISLIGGTGVGKSYIFSTLAGVPDLSPSSASVRGFTRCPHISVEEKFKAFMPFEINEVEFVPSFLPAAVLIDTPDLDTINTDNVRLAKKSLEISDIIIFVTSPDKRSDFAIQQNILEWGNRKRWFFVMNKIDQVADVSAETLKNDFFNRIKATGFSPDDSFVFLLSAREPDSKEFNRFRDTLSAAHPIKLSQTLHEEACFRGILHAITTESEIYELNQLLMSMKNFHNRLRQQLLEAHQSVLESEKFRQLSSYLLMQRVFASVSGNRTLFLTPYFFLMNFFRENDALSPSKGLLKSIFTEHPGLKNPFKDETRFLQENALLPFSNIPPYPVSTNHDDAIINQVESAALEAQQRRTTAFYIFIGNLLPVVILIQALYRAIASWLTGTWLPADFFIHAGFLIIGSTLPGYLLLSSYLRRFCANWSFKFGENDCDKLITLDEKTAAVELLLHDSSMLASECSQAIKNLQKELPSGIYGSSTSS